MEKMQNNVISNETSTSLQEQDTENQKHRPVKYISRNKFLQKYNFPATIFDRYISTGRLPFHRAGKVIEVEEYSTLETLRQIELENAEVARTQSIKKPVAKPMPIVLTGVQGIKIRRKKLDA